MKIALVCSAIFCSATFAFGQDASATIQAVTFDKDKGVYVPVRELGTAVGAYVGWDNTTSKILFDDQPIDPKAVRKLFDKTNLVDVTKLADLGLKMEPIDGEGHTVSYNAKSVTLQVPDKWVEVSIKHQTLRGYQGDRLVIETNVSTGRAGFRTPTGSFTAGPEKSRMRYSRAYNNSPMPYAVQVYGGVFIHGYKSVPSYPASHGCVRMPLTGQNAAEYFFDWVHVGTPIAIRSDWSDKVTELSKASGTDSDRR